MADDRTTPMTDGPNKGRGITRRRFLGAGVAAGVVGIAGGRAENALTPKDGRSPTDVAFGAHAATSTASILPLAGGAPNTITARTWTLQSQLVEKGHSDGKTQHVWGEIQIPKDEGAWDYQLGDFYAGVTLGEDVPMGVGLSLQDSQGVGNDRGWLFRSGKYVTLPDEDINIISTRYSISDEEVVGLLPSLPYSVGDVTIDVMKPTLQPGSVLLAVEGTVAGGSVGFTLTTTLRFFPSSAIELAPFEAVVIAMEKPQFAFTGKDILSGGLAALLNLVRPVIERDVLPGVRQQVQSLINGAVLSQAGSDLDGGTLPDGVILSLRSIVVVGLGRGIDVTATIASFGDLYKRLGIETGESSCFIATAVYGEESPDLDVLRRFRDMRLRRTSLGRGIVAVYERTSPPLARLIATTPILRTIARRLIVDPAAWIAYRSLSRTARVWRR